MSGYLGARTQIADTGAYNREQADDLFPSKESVVAFSSTGADTTMVKPPVYGIRVLEFTGATGTITLPDMSGQPGGGRFRILKNNATQGAVNINLSGTNVGIWGSVQLKLNADGDFWEIQWTGSRFVLTDGHETGSNANGEWIRYSGGKQSCVILSYRPQVLLDFSSGDAVSVNWVYPVPFIFNAITIPVLYWLGGGGSSARISTAINDRGNSFATVSVRDLESGGSPNPRLYIEANGHWYSAS